MQKYFQLRARLVTELKKYPHIMDNHQAVVECDHLQYVNLCLSAIELRNNYACVFDIIRKNIDKIVKPKAGNATAHLY